MRVSIGLGRVRSIFFTCSGLGWVGSPHKMDPWTTLCCGAVAAGRLLQQAIDVSCPLRRCRYGSKGAQYGTDRRNISVDTSRHEVARGHCDRRPRHCCMSHSDELPSANALSALQHHLSGTLSLSLFRTVTRSRYLNLDLKHICSSPSMLRNCPVRQRL